MGEIGCFLSHWNIWKDVSMVFMAFFQHRKIFFSSGKPPCSNHILCMQTMFKLNSKVLRLFQIMCRLPLD